MQFRIVKENDHHLGGQIVAQLWKSIPTRPRSTSCCNPSRRLFGERSIGVILTGMGHDGLEGMKAIKAAGGRTVAQDEASSVVYGMPKAVVEAGCAEKVVSLSQRDRRNHEYGVTEIVSSTVHTWRGRRSYGEHDEEYDHRA
jgi:two-component system chemotaxis response regulator CheB